MFSTFHAPTNPSLPCCQEVDGTDGEVSGTLQAKKRALLGQKDRLRLLKKVQSGKERVQRKMERGRSSKGEGVRSGGIGSIPESKPVATETRWARVASVLGFPFVLFRLFQPKLLLELMQFRLFCPFFSKSNSTLQPLYRAYNGRLRPGAFRDGSPFCRIFQRYS